ERLCVVEHAVHGLSERNAVAEVLAHRELGKGEHRVHLAGFPRAVGRELCERLDRVTRETTRLLNDRELAGDESVIAQDAARVLLIALRERVARLPFIGEHATDLPDVRLVAATTAHDALQAADDADAERLRARRALDVD